MEFVRFAEIALFFYLNLRDAVIKKMTVAHPAMTNREEGRRCPMKRSRTVRCQGAAAARPADGGAPAAHAGRAERADRLAEEHDPRPFEHDARERGRGPAERDRVVGVPLIVESVRGHHHRTGAVLRGTARRVGGRDASAAALHLAGQGVSIRDGRPRGEARPVAPHIGALCAQDPRHVRGALPCDAGRA